MSAPGIPRLTGFEKPEPEPPPEPLGRKIVNAIAAVAYRAWRALAGENPRG